MATENNNENSTSNLKADRQYLVDSGTNRLIMITLLVGGISLMALLLFLAAYGKTGRYTDPDRTQYEATLNNAAIMLEGGDVAADNAARVTLPIDTAIRAVADKGLGTITSSLKQTGTPPAPAQVAPVEEVMPTEEAMPTEEVAPVETTQAPEAQGTEVVETVEAPEVVTTSETMTSAVETTTENTASTVVATATTAGVAAVSGAVDSNSTVTETVEAPASTVVTEVIETTTPVVEATTSAVNSTVNTSSQTITTNTTTVIGGSTLTMSNGMTVQINKDAYNACVVCHQVNGQGIITVFPPLANHAAKLFNEDRSYLPNVVLYGIEGEINIGGLSYNEPMRRYPDMSDEDIAGVLNYILTTWGNESLITEDFQPYAASEIASLRGQNLGPEAIQALRAGMNLN